MFNYELILSLLQTAIMTLIPTISAIVFGIPIGAMLYLTNKNGIKENMKIYVPVNLFVNIVRSFPFLIFVILLIPITRGIFGTAFGVIPASFPICFVSIALYSRFVEQSFIDINKGVIDLAISMRATTFQIVRYFLIVEAMPSLILGITSVIISIISYTTVMGIVGGGGIGDYAIRYGYYEYNYERIYFALIIMMIIVFLIQYLGNKLSIKTDKRKV